jgi:dynein light intermediate chain
MTLAAYQTLYHGSVIFGIRKQLQAEQGRAELETKIEELDIKKIYLENRVFIRNYSLFIIIQENRT